MSRCSGRASRVEGRHEREGQHAAHFPFGGTKPPPGGKGAPLASGGGGPWKVTCAAMPTYAAHPDRVKEASASVLQYYEEAEGEEEPWPEEVEFTDLFPKFYFDKLEHGTKFEKRLAENRIINVYSNKCSALSTTG